MIPYRAWHTWGSTGYIFLFTTRAAQPSWDSNATYRYTIQDQRTLWEATVADDQATEDQATEDGARQGGRKPINQTHLKNYSWLSFSSLVAKASQLIGNYTTNLGDQSKYVFKSWWNKCSSQGLWQAWWRKLTCWCDTRCLSRNPHWFDGQLLT